MTFQDIIKALKNYFTKPVEQPKKKSKSKKAKGE